MAAAAAAAATPKTAGIPIISTMLTAPAVTAAGVGLPATVTVAVTVVQLVLVEAAAAELLLSARAERGARAANRTASILAIGGAILPRKKDLESNERRKKDDFFLFYWLR